MGELCASLNALSIGPLATVEGPTPAGVHIRYVHLASVDLNQIDAHHGLEVATCYDHQEREGQRQRIYKNIRCFCMSPALFHR